jgi:preprotein translocase subunit YajC
MPMYAYGILIGVVLVVVVWFLFIAPMERRMHDRKMELMRRKLVRNEERLKQMKDGID